jgi:hypothetical protein
LKIHGVNPGFVADLIPADVSKLTPELGGRHLTWPWHLCKVKAESSQELISISLEQIDEVMDKRIDGRPYAALSEHVGIH